MKREGINCCSNKIGKAGELRLSQPQCLFSCFSKGKKGKEPMSIRMCASVNFIASVCTLPPTLAHFYFYVTL